MQMVHPMRMPRGHIMLLDLLLLLDFVSKTLLFLVLITFNFEYSGLGPTAQTLVVLTIYLKRFRRSL